MSARNLATKRTAANNKNGAADGARGGAGGGAGGGERGGEGGGENGTEGGGSMVLDTQDNGKRRKVPHVTEIHSFTAATTITL